MSGRLASQPSAGRWHAIGLIAFLWLVGIYSVKARLGGAGDPRLYGLLGGAVLAAVAAALVGRLRGRQESRALLAGWPVASLLLTTVVGAVDPAVTRDFPGTITITFAYIGLTCPRWRSLAFVPLGVAAFVVGGAKALGDGSTSVLLAAAMWVIVAEVPAWLIARLEEQSALLRKVAHTDALTQLLDRSTLGPRLSAHASESAVVVIDLDNFKRYNDTHGHSAGDELWWRSPTRCAGRSAPTTPCSGSAATSSSSCSSTPIASRRSGCSTASAAAGLSSASRSASAPGSPPARRI